MLLVCTSSTETQLARLQDLMDLLGATASSSGLDLALTQATGWVERHITGGGAPGSIRRQVYLETLGGTGSQRLMLSRTPVWAVQRLFDSTDTGQATAYCSTDFRVENAEAGFIEMTNGAAFESDALQGWNIGPMRTISGYPIPYGSNKRWLVVYEAGWQLNCASSTAEYVTTSTYRTLPDEIERAVLLKAAEFWQGDSRGISQMRVGPLHMNFSSEALDPVVELLAPYRRAD